jgi:hypothetical protein
MVGRAVMCDGARRTAIEARLKGRRSRGKGWAVRRVSEPKDRSHSLGNVEEAPGGRGTLVALASEAAGDYEGCWLIGLAHVDRATL